MPAFFDEARMRMLIELLAPDRITRIADIGANPIHVPDYDKLHKIGACEIWGFEPLPEAFSALQNAAQPGEHYLPYAIGDGAKGQFHVCASGGFSSLLLPDTETLDYLGRWHRAMQVTKQFEVQTHRLDDLGDLPSPDFVKIDIQGGELDVFQNGREKLKDAVAIVSEVAFAALYTDQPMFFDQARELSDQGFELNRFLSLKSKALGSPLMQGLDWRKHQNRLIDGDALFVRRLAAPETWSDEALKHLAILADGVFESFDLCVKCLHILAERGTVSDPDLGAYLAQVPHQKNGS